MIVFFVDLFSIDSHGMVRCCVSLAVRSFEGDPDLAGLLTAAALAAAPVRGRPHLRAVRVRPPLGAGCWVGYDGAAGLAALARRLCRAGGMLYHVHRSLDWPDH